MAPRITSKTYGTATMDQWVREFWDVYKDQDRQRSPSEMWLMTTYDGTQAGRAIREEDVGAAMRRVAHCFCWVATFAHKILRQDTERLQFPAGDFRTLEDIVWFKYPWACPACGAEVCDCPRLKRTLSAQAWRDHRARVWAEDIPRLRKLPRRHISALDEWGSLFQHVYQGAHGTQRLEEIGFHLLEEIGEASEAIVVLSGTLVAPEARPALAESLFRELADVVSWIFSLVNKIRAHYEHAQQIPAILQSTRAGDAVPTDQITLSRILWAFYKLEDADFIGCPKCGDQVCDPLKCTTVGDPKPY